MGVQCCSSRIEFSKTIDQTQMVELIEEERKPYDLRLKSLIEKALKDAVEAGMKGVDQKKALKKIQENEIKQGEIIKCFLDGVTEVQNRLRSKEYSDYQKIGVLLEEYFHHASDKEDSHIKDIRKNMNSWFEKH